MPVVSLLTTQYASAPTTGEEEKKKTLTPARRTKKGGGGCSVLFHMSVSENIFIQSSLPNPSMRNARRRSLTCQPSSNELFFSPPLCHSVMSECFCQSLSSLMSAFWGGGMTREWQNIFKPTKALSSSN